jgi:hypothetical protein
MPEVVYIAGPISGKPDYVRVFKEADLAIQHEFPDAEIINPVELDTSGKQPWAYYLRRDLSIIINKATIIIALPGWEDSRGAALEVTVATKLGIIVLAYPTYQPIYPAKPENAVLRHLQQLYPHGHPAFLPLLMDIASLHSDKNHDYAGGGDPLGNFKRVSSIMSMYPGLPLASPTAVAMIYALKQMDAVLWGLSQNLQHKVEGATDRLRDVAVYALLSIIMIKEAGCSH